MSQVWWETKEKSPEPKQAEPFRDLQDHFHCASCGKQVFDIYVTDTPNFLCGPCRKKWKVKP